ALMQGTEQVTIAAPFQPAIVRYPTAQGTVDLELLATGYSNFEHSPEGRDWNVRKALRERVHNVVIPANTVQSFNDTLGVPITNTKGWKDALGIFGGGTAMTPGGGICQAA